MDDNSKKTLESVDDKQGDKSMDDKKEEEKKDTTDDNSKKTLESGDDKKEDKSVDDKQEEWTYNKGWNERGLSNAGKKRLNRQTRDLVRPVHVSALAYTLPDKTKKCCMTWREAISLHEEKTGKRPNWSSQFLQCKLCGSSSPLSATLRPTTPGVTLTWEFTTKHFGVSDNGILQESANQRLNGTSP